MCHVETLEKTVLASLFLFLLESALSGGLPCCCFRWWWWTAWQPAETAAPETPAAVLVHPANRETLEEDEHMELLSHPLARFACSDAPASHAAFGDHGVDYQQDSKMSFLCTDHVRDSKEGTLGQLGRASL